MEGNDFELIPTVKVEIRQPIEGYFSSEFPAICNQCGVAKKLKKFENVFAFCFGKTTLYGKIF